MPTSTDTDLMFSKDLPWRQQATAMNRDFPQFRDLLVAVVQARIPEEADATAAGLADEIGKDKAHFLTVRRLLRCRATRCGCTRTSRPPRRTRSAPSRPRASTAPATSG